MNLPQHQFERAIQFCDLPKNQESGLIHASSVLESLDDIAVIKFDYKDIVRHKLVKTIIKAYKK